MSIDTVLGTAGSLLAPFAELLFNETIISIIVLLYVLVKFENWLNRKAALGVYEQELLLVRDKAELKKKIMEGDWKDRIDFDKIAKRLAGKMGDPTDEILKIPDDFELEKWR